MQDYVLFTDSTTDLSPALIEEMDAVVMPMSFTLNGQSYKNYPDGREMPMADFYAALRSGGMSTTSQLTMEMLRETFTPVLEQGKDVFAVPATPTDDRAKGVNHLIKNGAPLVENASDIIEHLQSAPLFSLSEKAFIRSDPPIPPALPSEPDDTDRNRVLSLLDGAPVEIDLLIRETGLPADAISVLLVELELAGQIERLPGNRVLRVISL